MFYGLNSILFFLLVLDILFNARVTILKDFRESGDHPGLLLRISTVLAFTAFIAQFLYFTVALFYYINLYFTKMTAYETKELYKIRTKNAKIEIRRDSITNNLKSIRDSGSQTMQVKVNQALEGTGDKNKDLDNSELDVIFKGENEGFEVDKMNKERKRPSISARKIPQQMIEGVKFGTNEGGKVAGGGGDSGQKLDGTGKPRFGIRKKDVAGDGSEAKDLKEEQIGTGMDEKVPHLNA